MKCANKNCSACGSCDLTFLECPLYDSSRNRRGTTNNAPNLSAERQNDKKRISNQQNQTSAYRRNYGGLTEDGEQEVVIQYCRLNRIEVVHIPNESKRSVAYGAKMKRMGLRKGFPDMFIPTAKKNYHGLFIELKRDDKCKPTPDQLQWIEYLNKQGYYATVCYGAGQAIDEIRKYFKENYPDDKT